MTKFHKLKGNDSDFPILENVNVYKYDNDFEYSRYIPDQMEIQICSVPWDMGEAHIGNRTISGIGNVVYFGSADVRDAWFDAIPDTECLRFSTKYKELHRDLYIDVPVPFDVCAKYNYVAVSYSLFANDDSPVMYETENGMRKWFWFIREVEFIAPNNTRLHILDDAFQTWIYDIDVTGMILERGHAPMFAVNADDYLADPIENNEYLLTDDVNFGEAGTVKHIDVLELNAGTMYACIATSANPKSNWGTKANNTWRIPVSDSYTANGQPSYYVFAMPASNLNSFLANINDTMPQFRETVQGVFFASSDLITLGDSFTVAGITCYNLVSYRKSLDLMQLNKSLFGYDSRYSDIAKLYTSPYAHIEVTDEDGNVDVIKIEDSTGTLQVSAAMSIAYPFVTIDAHVLGVGGSETATVTFKNINNHTFNIGGQWYETLHSWNVPTFAVIASPQDQYDWATHYDRLQRAIDYDTAYDNAAAKALAAKTNADNIANAANQNALDSATTAKSNADAYAATSKTNADASSNANKLNADDSATLITDNALLARTANTAITNASNASADRTLGYTRSYNFDVYDSDNSIINASATSSIAAQEQQAAISAASGAAGGVVGAIASAATGNIAGAISSAVNGIIGGASTLASTNVAIHLTSAEAAIQTQSNSYHAEASTEKTENDITNQKTTSTNITNLQNTLNEGQSANSAATTASNALRTNTTELANNAASYTTSTANNAASYNTDTANANRTLSTELAANTLTYNTAIANAGREKSRAQSDIANDIKQAGLRQPFVYGTFANGEGSATKPIALFANVVTQSKAAISAAGDEFLRYGYAFDKQWHFDGNWNVGKYFTYWKLKDFWVRNLNVPDMYMDKLRFFLYGGVTVWKAPEYIGNVDIYENFN